MKDGMDPLDKERLDVLAGVRAQGSRQAAAVRRRDLAALLPLPELVSAAAVSGSITVAQYNALREDIITIRRILAIIGQQVKP